MRKTKTQKVIEHLETKGHITSLEAFKFYHATRLGSIIFNLRKRGMNIITETIVTKENSYAKYIFLQKMKRKP